MVIEEVIVTDSLPAHPKVLLQLVLRMLERQKPKLKDI